MYNSVCSSQHALASACQALNKLQVRVLELEKVVQTSISSVGDTSSNNNINSNNNNNNIDAMKAMVQSMVTNVVQDVLRAPLEGIRKDIESCRRDMEQSTISNKSSSSPPINETSSIEVHIRKECETSAKKHRDLLEALLTTKYDRMIAKSVQDICETQRQELLTRIRSCQDDVLAVVDMRIAELLPVPAPAPASAHEHFACEEGDEDVDVVAADNTNNKSSQDSGAADSLGLEIKMSAPKRSAKPGRGSGRRKANA